MRHSRRARLDQVIDELQKAVEHTHGVPARPGGCRFRERKLPAAPRTPRSAIHPLRAASLTIRIASRTLRIASRPPSSAMGSLSSGSRPLRTAPRKIRDASRKRPAASRTRSRACERSGRARFGAAASVRMRRAALQGRVSASVSSMSVRTLRSFLSKAMWAPESSTTVRGRRGPMTPLWSSGGRCRSGAPSTRTPSPCPATRPRR
jgi:hypothetical protein